MNGDGGGGGGGGGDGGSGCCDAARDGSLATGSDAMPCMASCPSGEWCSESASIATSTKLVSTWAADDDHVFAVGDAGTILLRRCTGWTTQTSNTTMNLTGVWAASASDAWAVGDSGTLLHYDGSTWTAVSGQSSDFTGVWGSATDDVWAADLDGSTIHYNGSSWSTSQPHFHDNLVAIGGTSGSDVWVAGESVGVQHYTGSWSMTLVNPAGSPPYLAIYALTTTNVWLTSSVTGDETMEYNGTSWTPHATSGNLVQALWARSASDIYAVAPEQQAIGHWNGSSWSFATPSGVTQSLEGVTGTATDVYVVGTGATILHAD